MRVEIWRIGLWELIAFRSATTSSWRAVTYIESKLLRVASIVLKGTNPALKKPSNIPEIYAKMFGRFH